MFRLFALSMLFAYIPLATAVERDYFGEGQVLLFPFFTVENDWDTYVNVSLTPRDENILKLRVLDGADGNVVDTFNVYTRQNENFRAAIYKDDNGQPFLRVIEGACVISETGELGGVGNDLPLATGTGLLEVYSVSYELVGAASSLDCDSLAARWLPGGAWALDPLENLRPRSRDIVGHFNLVNVEQGLSAEHSATGLKNFLEFIPHTAPENGGSPSLTDADPIAKLANGDEVEPETGEGIDAIALLLSTQNTATIVNDVVTSEAIGASTDWIVSFPLRGYKDYGSYPAEVDGVMRTCSQHTVPANGPSVDVSVSNYPWLSWGGGDATGGSNDIDPSPVASWAAFLCYSINVLSFNEDPSIFLPPSSKLLTAIDPRVLPESPSSTVAFAFTDGRSDPDKNDGRPVLAFRATTFVNGTLDGGSVLANYMILKPHVVR